ncbi:MAG: hypothetical protein GY859_37130 [Desulfobacterales bacterium]|nr:hypothetical protein [Desulfobacterales bacterium]
MPRSTDEYHETNDIYLKMLRNAQNQEDKKLVQLIQQKMKANRPKSYVTETGCKVIPFPLSLLPLSPPSENVDFWKDQRFWKELIQCLGIFTFFLVWFLFFISLLMDKGGK